MAIGTAIGLGVGLIGAWQGKKAANKKFGNYGGIDKAIKSFNPQLRHLKGLDQDFEKMSNTFMNSNRGLGQFRTIAQDAGPSRADMMATAAATGGSSAAAGKMAQQSSLEAGNQALSAFGQYRGGLDSLAANLMSQRGNLAQQRTSVLSQKANLGVQKNQMQQQDFNLRRQGNTSFWNNIASMGTGFAGQKLGQGAAAQGSQQARGFGAGGINNNGSSSLAFPNGWNGGTTKDMFSNS